MFTASPSALVGYPKAFLRTLYTKLPFEIAVRVARKRPAWAFYIRERDRTLLIHDYLERFSVNIDTGSDIERRMLSRRYDSDILAVIERFVTPGQVCMDVGANVGAHLFALADRVGPTGFVHAFEPGPVYISRLKANLDMNPSVAKRVSIHEVGVSDSVGELQWQESVRDRGTASCVWVDPSRPVHKIPTTTLDAQAASLALNRLDFLKIDVDGMDHLVLRGGRETILKHRPTLVFETLMCDAEQKKAALQASEQLEQAGYKLYRIGRHGKTTLTQYPYLSGNTLAVP